ncbi:uncharacterized protein AB9X84_015942 [Acanthopagrus schlegelii]
MRLDLWFLFSCCFLTLGSALNCSLIQDNDQPTLVISGLPKVPAVYTWANSSGHVLAQNDQETPGLVLRNTNTTLVTSGCIEDVYYTSTIVSTAERYTAHCQVNCTENAHLWETKEPPHISPLRAVLVALVALIPCIVVPESTFHCCEESPDAEVGNE